MTRPPANQDNDDSADPEADPWFLPAVPDDLEPSDMPWPVAARETSLAPEVWRGAEAAQYPALMAAAEALVRFGERLAHQPKGVADRFALASVSAVLRGEGIWLGAEQIALYQALRTGSDDAAQDLARAAWAMRRLTGSGRAAGPVQGLHDFLGRAPVPVPQDLPGEDRATGAELEALGHSWRQRIEAAGPVHPLTRAALGFAAWRAEGITPWEELLEPTVAAMLVGAEGRAPFLPMAPGQRLDHHAVASGAGGAEARLAIFYAATEAGTLAACLELDRLTAWRGRAARATADLSGRTPPLLIEALLRFPVLSADLVADVTGCSRPAARRNLALFAERELIRETTGQDRYRFWTVRL